MEWKQNGIGMEKKMTNHVEAKFDGMELKWNGNGVEKVGEKLFCKMYLEMERNGNGMEMEIIKRSVWSWDGIDWIVWWNFQKRGNGKGME